MARRKKQSQSGLLAVFVIVLVFASGSAMLFLRIPEEVNIQSSDLSLTVKGISRGLGDVRVLPVASEGDINVFQQYELLVSGKSYVHEAELRFDASRFSDVTEVYFYHFDRSVLSWRVLPTVVDLPAKHVFTQLDLMGSQLIGVGYLEGVE